MNSQQPSETQTVTTKVESAELPPPVPPLPPQRQAAPAAPVASVAALPPREVKDPAWWRLGAFPMAALLLAAAAGDLVWPTSLGSWGIGAGIGCVLLITAILLLRRDFSLGEKVFLVVLALISLAALTVSGSGFNGVMALLLPFLLCLVPSRMGSTSEPGPFRNWWSYWFARRKQLVKSRWGWLRQILPTLITVLVAVVLFILFLCIFASGNPVVELVWNTITDWWNALVEYLELDWDFALHVLLWIVGIVAFGLYTLPRSKAAPAAPPMPVKEKEGSSILPHLPLASLIGINLAFLVATSTDIAYLWFGSVPEGVSQTAYLHDGAASITWASALASVILVFLFRRNGSARQGLVTRIAGFALVAQTFLLAVSVYLRLYHQIDDMGFTTRRIQAAEALLLGLDGLVILVCYMACSGSFWKYTRICLGSMLLLFVAFGICQPAELAGNLNLRYAPSHPHWTFDTNDFGHTRGRFVVGDNLAFAKFVFDKNYANMPAGAQPTVLVPQGSYIAPDEYSVDWFWSRLVTAARAVERRAQEDSWTTWSYSQQRDLPVAMDILYGKREPQAAVTERDLTPPANAASGNEAQGSTTEAKPETTKAPAAKAAAAQPVVKSKPKARKSRVSRLSKSRAKAPKRVVKTSKSKAKAKAKKKSSASKRMAKSTKSKKSSRSASKKRVASKSKPRKTTRKRRYEDDSEDWGPYPYAGPRRVVVWPIGVPQGGW